MALVTDAGRLEVLKNALEGIADGMAMTVMRTARSSVVRQSTDFSTAILSEKGDLIGQGFCLPPHMGGMVPALEAVKERYEGQMLPGDMYVLNDPYEGGSHLPDIFVFKPVFHNTTIISYVCAMAHHTDIGGRVAGGNACDSTEIFQEGLRIPPVKLFDEGVPNETVFRILEKAVRVPDIVMGDLAAQVAAIHYGEEEFLKIGERYGVENLQQYTEELLDYTEELTRAAIRKMPDGSWTFTDYIDDDGFDPGPIVITATVTKKDDEILVDFTGTSPQCKGAIQPVFATTKAVVYAALKTVLDNEIPNTSGYFRPLTITAPEGTIAYPMLPAPVAARALGNLRIANAVFGAFAQMLPDVVYAACAGSELGVGMGGYDKSKTPWKPWVLLEFHNEPGRGGMAARDGHDGVSAGITNQANVPAETIEAEHPVKVLEYNFVADTEGAGLHRGSMGMVRAYEYTMADTVLQVRSDRQKYAPYGLHGGESSSTGSITVTQDGETKTMPSKFLMDVGKGDSIRVVWPGGGGWGDPKTRDPQMVLQDVIEEKVTPERAVNVYCVALTEDDAGIDWKKTEKLRNGKH